MSSGHDSKPAVRVTATMLADIGLFGGLAQELLELLAAELPTRHVETGEVVVEEGNDAREMFVVLGGELEVFKRGQSGGEVRVALFGPGDWFGEMSVIDPHPRSATVRAVAPTLLLRITPEDVDTLFYRRDVKSYALFVMNIARELSRRLRVADGLVAQFVATVADVYQRKSERPPPP